MKASNLCLLLFLVFLCIKMCRAQKEGYVLGSKIANVILPSQGGQHFLQTKIHDPKSDQYLFFNLQIGKEQSWQRVKLTVKKDSEPNKSLLVCEESGSQICFIKGSQLENNQTLLIDIECQDKCNYQFESYWKQMTELVDRKLQYLQSSEGQEAQIFFFNTAKIPKNTTQIRLILLQSNKMSLFNAAKIYVNTNNSFPTNNMHLFESNLLKNGNQGVFLSRKMFEDKNLTILIIKEKSTSYSLTLQTRRPQFQQLVLQGQKDDFTAQNLPENRYVIDFSALPGSNAEQIFNIELNLYKGKVDISFFTDQNMIEQFQLKKRTCSQRCEYSIKGRELFTEQDIKKLYITISPNQFENIYSISLKRQNNYGYHELQEQANQCFKVKDKDVVFAKFADNNFTSPTVLPLDFFLNSSQSFSLSFSICFESSIKDCTGKMKQTLTQALTPSILTQNQKSIYRIELKRSHYNYLTKQKNQGIILIEFSRNLRLDTSQNYIEIMYKNLNSIVNLQDFDTMEDEIRKGEIKYYHYYNQKAQQQYNVQFNFKLLTGYADLYISDEDPRITNNSDKIKVQSTHMINYKPKKNIYLTIQGKSSSIYVFTLKAITKQQHKQQQTQKQVADAMQIKENVEQYIALKPLQSINFIVYNQQQVEIFYEASSSIGICQRQNNSSKCQLSSLLAKGNKNRLVMKAEKGQQTINGKIVSLRDDWTSQVRLTVFSSKSTQNETCIKKTVGILYNDMFKKESCFQFVVKQDVNLKAILVSSQRVPFNIQANLCGKELNIKQSIFSINKALIDYNCFQKDEKTVRIKIVPTENIKGMKMTYILQEQQKPLMLPDGIGFADSGLSHNGQLKRFYYKALNKDDVEIMIHCKQGFVKGYAKIVEYSQINTVKINSNSYDFSTQTDTFQDISPRLIVPKEFLQNRKCANCTIVISIWADKQTSMAQSISYIIEATQGNTLLIQNEPYRTFIQKNSVLYFRYQCQSNQRQLYFLASDNDQQTVKIYMNDEQYPNQEKKIKSVYGNQLSIKCEKDNYYFAVEAVQSSIVSVVIETSLNEIRSLIPGIPIQTKLVANYPLFFTFTHVGNKGFKLFALNQYGNIGIKIIRSTEEILQKIIEGEDLKLVQQLQKQTSYPGNLYMSTKDALYCTNCTYIGILEAGSNDTNVSLILYENKQELVMSTDNLFRDTLQKNDRIDLEYYLALKGKIQVQVYTGQIQITIQYDGNTKSVVYNTSSPKNTTFNFLDPTLNYDWQPLYIGIFNKNQTIANYSLKIYKDNEDLGKYYIIKNNEKKILVIVPNEIFCVRGTMQNNSEKLFLVLMEGQNQMLEKVDIKLSVNGEKTNYSKQQVHSSLEISIQQQIQSTVNYSMCMVNSNPTAVTFMALQSNYVELMKAEQQNYIHQSTILLVNLQSQEAMFDILTCQGQVNYSIADTFDQIMDMNRPVQFLDSVQLRQMQENQQNHVIYKKFDNNIGYLKVYGSDAMVKAYSIDYNKNTGMGYKNYAAGEISYEALDEQFKIIWQNIHQTGNSASKITEINFKIILAENPQTIKSTANCGKHNDTNIYILQEKIKGEENCHAVSQQTINSKIIKKSDIKQNFDDIKEMHIPGGTFFYVTIVADFKINVQMKGQSVIEQYKLTYPSIEIPRDLVLMEGHTTQKYRLMMAFTFALIAIAILSLIGIVYILTKKMIPIISKVKTRNFLTEQRTNTSKNSMQQQPQITTTHKGITPQVNL